MTIKMNIHYVAVSYACCLTESDGGFVLDPRSDHFIGMSSPIPSIAICVAYVPIVCWILPKFMQHKQPYDLRQLMMIYNFAMVLLSGYICLEVYQNCRKFPNFHFLSLQLVHSHNVYATQICTHVKLTLCTNLVTQFALSGWLTGYTFGCQLVDYSDDPKAIRVGDVTTCVDNLYMYYIIPMMHERFLLLSKDCTHTHAVFSCKMCRSFFCPDAECLLVVLRI